MEFFFGSLLEVSLISADGIVKLNHKNADGVFEDTYNGPEFTTLSPDDGGKILVLFLVKYTVWPV